MFAVQIREPELPMKQVYIQEVKHGCIVTVVTESGEKEVAVYTDHVKLMMAIAAALAVSEKVQIGLRLNG